MHKRRPATHLLRRQLPFHLLRQAMRVGRDETAICAGRRNDHFVHEAIRHPSLRALCPVSCPCRVRSTAHKRSQPPSQLTLHARRVWQSACVVTQRRRGAPRHGDGAARLGSVQPAGSVSTERPRMRQGSRTIADDACAVPRNHRTGRRLLRHEQTHGVRALTAIAFARRSAHPRPWHVPRMRAQPGAVARSSRRVRGENHASANA